MTNRVLPENLKPGDIIVREVIDYREATNQWKRIPFKVTAINIAEEWVDLAWETGADFGRYGINPNELVTRLDSFGDNF